MSVCFVYLCCVASVIPQLFTDAGERQFEEAGSCSREPAQPTVSALGSVNVLLVFPCFWVQLSSSGEGEGRQCVLFFLQDLDHCAQPNSEQETCLEQKLFE